MQAAAPSWHYFPDHTGGNPYQARLAEGLAAQGWAARAGDIAAALSAARAGPAVFHLHWEQPAYGVAPDAAGAMALAARFGQMLDAFRAAGGLLVWTVHNGTPHEERFPAANLAIQRGLAQRADLVHVHNHAGARHAIALGASPDSVLLFRHPNFDGAYPDDITDAAARRYLGLDGADTVFAFFGALRGYKGLPRLIRAFESVHLAHPKTRLVVAGWCPTPSEARFLAPMPGLRLLHRQVADAEIQYVMRAADCVVLPYEAVLTSGSLALAQGFGRPVVVPALPSLCEEVRDGANGFLYAPGCEAALAAALLRAVAALPILRGAMRTAARATVAGRDFTGLAAALAGLVGRAVPNFRAA